MTKFHSIEYIFTCSYSINKKLSSQQIKKKISGYSIKTKGSINGKKKKQEKYLTSQGHKETKSKDL